MLLPNDLIELLVTRDERGEAEDLNDVGANLEESLMTCRVPTRAVAEDVWRRYEARSVPVSIARAAWISSLQQTPESVRRTSELCVKLKRDNTFITPAEALWRLPISRVAEVLPLIETEGMLRPAEQTRLSRRLGFGKLSGSDLWEVTQVAVGSMDPLDPEFAELDDLVDALTPHESLADTVLAYLRGDVDPENDLLPDVALRVLGRWRREEAVDIAATFLANEQVSDPLFECCTHAIRNAGSLPALTRMAQQIEDKSFDYAVALVAGLEAIRTPESAALTRALADRGNIYHRSAFAMALATMGCTDPDTIALQRRILDDPDIESADARNLIYVLRGMIAATDGDAELISELDDREEDLLDDDAFFSDEGGIQGFPKALLTEYLDAEAELAEMASAPRSTALDVTKPLVSDKKVGRNDPCPCGSGKKYKKCCGG